MTSLAQLERGVVGYWCPMLATTGLRLYDRSVRKNHGTLTNMDPPTDWVGANILGRFGRALDFDGSNDIVDCGTSVPRLGNQHTFSAWIYPTDNNDRMISGMCDFIFVGGIEWAVRTAGFSVAWFDGSIRGWFSGATVPLNQWSFVCCVFTLTQQRLTVNTTTTLTNNTTTGIVYNNDRFRIGVASTNSTFQGRQAENCLWNRALAAAEVRTLYRLGPGWFGRREPRRRYAVSQAAGFKAYWNQRAQLLGGGLR